MSEPNWTTLLTQALSPEPEKPAEGFFPLDVWMERFDLKSPSNAFLALRKLTKLGKMDRKKYRVADSGRISYRSYWRWLT